MAFYVGGIAIADLAFRGKYVLWDEYWISSITCTLIGLFQIVSIEMSFIAFITLNLLYIYVLGYKTHRGDVGLSTIIGNCSVSWLLVIAFGLVLILSIDDMPSGLCMFTNSTAVSWYLNFGLFVFNSILHVMSVLSLWELMRILSRHSEALKEVGQVSKTPARSHTKALFVFSIMSNLVCRIPFEVFLLLSLTPIELEEHLLAWLAFLVFPMSSLVNPFIHTFRGVLLQSVSWKKKNHNQIHKVDA